MISEKSKSENKIVSLCIDTGLVTEIDCCTVSQRLLRSAFSSSDLNVKPAPSSIVCNSLACPEQSTVRHLLFHRQLQVVGYCRVNVSFLCGSNSDCYSEQR